MSNPTWETATDWDNAQSENQVMHEAINGERDGKNVYLGYPSYSPLSVGYTGYFPLNDPGGSSAVEDMAGSETLSVEGVTLRDTTGPTGTSAPYLDGTDDRCINSDISGTYLDVSGASELTLAAWIEWDGSGDDTILNYDGINTRLNINGNPNLVAKFVDDAGNKFIPFDSAVSDSQWHFVAGTYGASNAYLYRDATQVDSVSTNGNALDSNSTMPLVIGALSDTGGQWFPGNIAHCMVFTSQLSGSQIQTLYDVTSSGNLVGGKKTF